MIVNKRTFIAIGTEMQNRVRSDIAKRDFLSLFGITPTTCVDLWRRMMIPADSTVTPRHVLWGLLFLKVYASETVLCAIAKTTKKTFRYWIWMVIPRIAGLYPYLVSSPLVGGWLVLSVAQHLIFCVFICCC